MQLFCPTCATAYPAADRCPRCGDRLVTPMEAFETGAEHAIAPPDLIRPTALGRTLVGCVVALGLYLGMREWTSGALGTSPEWWFGSTGVLAATGLRSVSVFFGGLMAGAGRLRGILTGAIVGLIVGGALIAADGVMGAKPGPFDAAVAGWLVTLAALAGLIGGRVWPPAVDIPEPLIRSRGSSIAQLAQQDDMVRAVRPTRWVRILVGIAIVVTGVLGAESARDGLRQHSGGVVQFGGPSQAAFVDMQLAGLLALIGGAVAAGGTGAGLRHGIITAALAGGFSAALLLMGRLSPGLVAEGMTEFCNLTLDAQRSPRQAMLLFIGLIALVSTGGWFGGQLLPPLAPDSMRKRLPPTN